MLHMLLLALSLTTPALTIEPPKTPPGLPVCRTALGPDGPLPRLAGESIRYRVAVDGLQIGQVDFRVERNGEVGGKGVTEYRSSFKLDSLLSAIVSMDGQATAMVPLDSHIPQLASSRFVSRGAEFIENVTYHQGGLSVSADRHKDGVGKKEARRFVAPVQDFLSAFYSLRRAPRTLEGCSVVYENGRAYTFWVTPAGEERVKTPVGYKDADRYDFRFGSDRGKMFITGRLWLDPGKDRLPYRVEMLGPVHLVAEIHHYERAR
jgi:hypothetical protein